jgi:feruloyl esterase
VPVAPIPNTFDRFTLLANWVERKVAPGMFVVVTAGDKSLPLCSYPTYPKYAGGPASVTSSYTCVL